MFVNETSYHQLRGRAAEIKGLGKPLLKVWEHYMNKALSMHNRIRLMLQLNCDLDDQLDSHKGCYRLPLDAAAAHATTAFTMMSLYQELGEELQEEGIRCFSVTIKHHVLCHCALNAKWLHPRLTYCFSGEDFMGVVQKLWANCTRGTAIHKCVGKFIEAYRLSTHLRWTADDDLPLFLAQ